jgi:hypothetical protein
VGKTTMPKVDALMNDSFMVKRLTPQNGSVDFAKATGQELEDLVKRVAQLTADAHASGAEAGFATAQEILDALAPKKAFSHDLQKFSRGYAEQVRADYKGFMEALKLDPLLELPVVRARG